MNKTRQWAILTAVGCLAVLIAGWMLVVKPQRSHASSLRAQTASVQTNNTSLQSQIAQLRQQQKDLPAQQKLLSQIATKIPDNPALPSLIRQLSAAADGAGVDLVSLAPSTPTAATAASATVAPVSSIPVTINVQGSYFNVEQFFSSVETLNRAMLVSGFSLTPGGGSATPTAGSTQASSDLSAQITAVVFESPAVTAPATTTTVH